MQRFRVRFTVRQIMVLIAFMALVSAVVIQTITFARRDREIASLCDRSMSTNGQPTASNGQSGCLRKDISRRRH